MKKLKLTIGGKDFYGDLKTETMPEFCKKLEALTPFSTRGSIAKLATNEFMLPTRISYETPEHLQEYGKGDVMFFSNFQIMCVFHGDCECIMKAACVAHFSEEECERMSSEGLQIWYEPGKEVIVDVVEV